MLVKCIRALGLFAGLTLLPGIAGAQTAPCDPAKLYPGLTLRDLSRNTDGYIGSTPNTFVYFAECKSSGTITRNTLYQPFAMRLNAQGCDEIKEFDASLKGLYYSVKRLNDTHPDKDPAMDPNPYIGYEYASGDIIDNKTGAKLGTFTMNGVIGTNTSRVPMPDSTGDCYDCSHHQGYVTFTFTDQHFVGSATFAEYHFHTLGTAAGGDACAQRAPCDVNDEFRGVLDGIWLNRCG
jgi:hypothetical protein